MCNLRSYWRSWNSRYRNSKSYGAVVVACGGNDNKLNVCTEKGADFTINYNNKIIRKELKSLGSKK